jgi:lipopolysaccharide export system protein LptC
MAQGVRIPFDHDDEGRVKSEVYAERATVPDAEGETFAEKVRIVLSKDAKDTNATVIVTDACRINFSNKTVRSNSPIRLDQPGLTMTGNGFRWSGTTEQMRIVRDACVVTTRSFIEQRQGRSSAPTALPGFRKEGY